MAEPEEVQPYIVGKWAGHDNYECNIVENGINCPYATIGNIMAGQLVNGQIAKQGDPGTPLGLMREHLTGHGVYLYDLAAPRPRFQVGAPVANREAEETKAPPAPIAPEVIEAASTPELTPAESGRKRRTV